MKILVVGTGVIGTIYAKALAEKNEVLHFVRDEKMDAVNGKTICYDIVDERMSKAEQNTTGTYTYRCVCTADDSYDLILVPVKAFQLQDALHTLIRQAPKAKYLLFTLNWDGVQEIDSILNKDQYIMGYAGGGGTFQEDLLWANVGNDMMLGAVYPEQKLLLEKTALLFQNCGIMAEIPESPLHWLWMHNISTAPFGMALAKYRDMSKYLDDKALVQTTFRACRECCMICKKRGMDLKRFPEVKMYHLPLWFTYWMFRNNFKKNPVMQRYTAHAVDSIDEMEQNFIDIYRTGCELQVSMPNMEILKNILHCDGQAQELKIL